MRRSCARGAEAALSMFRSDKDENQRSMSSVGLFAPWTTAADIPTTMNLTRRRRSSARKG